MQQAIQYKAWFFRSSEGGNSSGSTPEPADDEAATAAAAGPSVGKLVAENAVIVFGRRGCCMCHVVKRLLLGLGVNPPVVEVEEQQEAAVIAELSGIAGGGEGGIVVQFPAVFVGGKLFGGLERVMSTHISGELIPILKEARALWL
ncbi:Thioredoxin-disulfide reductase [Bertholletia excelsa]